MRVAALVLAAACSTAAQAQLLVEPTRQTFSAQVSPARVTGGSSSTVTLTLASPTRGETVKLWTNNAAVTVPASIYISGGASSAAFNATTSPVAVDTAVEIWAQVGTASRRVATLTVIAPVPVAITGPTHVSSRPEGVQGPLAKVTLDGPAPPMFDVQVTRTAPAGTRTFSVTVPAGLREGTFLLYADHVAEPTPVSVVATRGSASVSFNYTLHVGIARGRVEPDPSTSGGTMRLVLELTGPPPPNIAFEARWELTSGVSATCTPIPIFESRRFTSEGTTAVLGIPIPPTLSQTGAFVITQHANPLGTTYPIIDSYQYPRKVPFTIRHAQVVSIRASQIIKAGDAGLLTIELDGPTPSPACSSKMLVYLQSDNAAVSVPPYVTIPSGAREANFPITASTASQQTATIAATRFLFTSSTVSGPLDLKSNPITIVP